MSGILQGLLASIGGVITDADFEYVTLLLPGNGTNGAQNNTFLDSSTNNFTITRNGNTTQGTFSPYGDNWSNYFDGTGDYLTAPSNTAFALGTGDFTVEFWFYLTVMQDSAFWGIGTSTTSGGVMFRLENPGTSFNLYNNGDNLFTGSGISANTWYHLAVVRSSGTLKVYVNGTQYGSSLSNSTNIAQDIFYIGCAKVGSTVPYNPINGYMSNIRVLKGTAQYTANFTPPTAPLTAITNTSLLTCQSNRFIDNSSNAFAITVNGNTSVQAFSPFLPTAAYSASTVGGSGYFDGTGDYLTLSGNTNLALGSGNFTIELWVNITSFTTYGTFATTYNNTPVAGTWFLRLNASTQQWQWQNGSDGGAPNFKAYNSSTNLIAGAWHHLAVVRSSGVVTLYQDGVNVGGGTDVETLVAPTFWIGQTINGYPMNGYISNLRVLKGTAQYTAAFTPPTAPLTAITNTQLLTNFTNAGITDATAKNDLETVGNAQISTTQSKFGGSSMYFDGTGDYLVSNTATTDLYAYGSGNFTIEMWAYFNSVSGYAVLYDGRASGANSTTPTIYTVSGTIYYYVSAADRITGSTLSTGIWYHIAVSRSNGTTRMFVNGTQVGSSYTDATVYTNTAGRPTIGGDGNAPGSNGLNGYIDDLRVTKGYARYTANFTAPTAAFPTS